MCAMDINEFIRFLRKKEEVCRFEQYVTFDRIAEAKTGQFFLPQASLKEQTSIHEKIFKDCVKQAASNCHGDDRVWKEFEWLFRDYCKTSGNLKQYSEGMRNAAAVAWSLIKFTQNQQEQSHFGTTFENEIFPGLKESILVDLCQPSRIYELRFTEFDRDEFEKSCLTNEAMKGVIQCVVSGIKQEHIKLGVVVFYWKTKSISLYTVNANQNEELVAMLLENLSVKEIDTPEENGRNNGSDNEGD